MSASTARSFFSDFDAHLFSEGTHYRIYEKLGAHIIERDGVKGTHFAVWAPNAQSVAVIGDFNDWNASKHPLTLMANTGVWTAFLPGIKQGAIYKYYIVGKNDVRAEKTDPCGFASELRPRTASVVWQLDQYKWQDKNWLDNRHKSSSLSAPISIYEVHLGSWMRVPEREDGWLTYRELADTLIPYVKEMGFTHVEVMPLSEHALDMSWGYQTTGYFAATSRFGPPEDFMYLVDQLHNNGIGVLMDWVPAHFPRDGHALGLFDGTHLYEHADPRQGEHQRVGHIRL
jgi:1,4-alpha-glucan branching enzyme